MTKTSSLESVINHAIANGARIQEGGLGTVLATEKQLAAADRFADQQARERDKRAGVLLAGCKRRVEQGEVRYYASPTRFAVMSRAGAVRWFEIRKDGVYADR